MSQDLVPSELGGLPILQSPLLLSAGIPHAFTLRRGGTSRPPFDSLNLGFSTGDEPARVLANRRRLCAAFGLPLEHLRFVKQVHGCDVVEPTAAWPTGADDGPPEADALLTDDPRWLIGVRTADCLPVLLATTDGRYVAAVHAGWRGLVQRILPNAVRRLCDRAGCEPDQLLAAVGPGIGAARYEVGPEVAAEFPDSCVRRPAGKREHVDCGGFAARQLQEAGIVEVDRSQQCTFAAPKAFFSYRRDGAATGRQAAVIRARA